METKISINQPLPLPHSYAENKKRRRDGKIVDLGTSLKERFEIGKNNRAALLKKMRETARASTSHVWSKSDNKTCREELCSLIPQIKQSKETSAILKKRLKDILEKIDLAPGEVASLPDQKSYVKRVLVPAAPCSRVFVQQCMELWLRFEKRLPKIQVNQETASFLEFLDNCQKHLPKPSYRNELKEPRIRESTQQEDNAEEVRRNKAARNSLNHLLEDDGNVVLNIEEAERRLKESKVLKALEKRERARKRQKKKNCIQQFLEEVAQSRAITETDDTFREALARTRIGHSGSGSFVPPTSPQPKPQLSSSRITVTPMSM
jgi:hypothetical protein